MLRIDIEFYTDNSDSEIAVFDIFSDKMIFKRKYLTLILKELKKQLEKRNDETDN